MRRTLKRYLPDIDALRQNKWLAMFGNTLLHPRLWHLNRHSAANAVAIGLFCGLLPAPFQMLSAALTCVVFRANLPLAVFTTLYTNPFTFVPLYLLAYKLGTLFLPGNHFVAPPGFAWSHLQEWAHAMLDWAIGLGKPLVLGVLVLASVLAVCGYVATHFLWRWHSIRAWRKRRLRHARHWA